MLSIYSKDTPFKVYCHNCWWSDKWNPMDYGRDYDFSKPFFQQFREFLELVPQSALQTMYTTFVNSDYCNIASYLKNCYLLFNSDYDENCAYSTYLENSKKSLDIFMGDLNELCYNSSNTFKDYKTLYSFNCNECINIYFSRNLLNCSDCIGCINLRNKKYHIFNQPYAKEEYLKKLSEFDFTSYNNVEKFKIKFNEFSLNYPRKHAEGLNNNNVSGDYVFNSKNAHKCYEVGKCENIKYCQFLFMLLTKDSYDMTMWGGNASRMYECMGAGDGEDNVKFSYNCWGNAMNLDFCSHILAQNNNLFACYGLRKQEYCIFNKQYSKEEYEVMREKIIDHMNEMPYISRAQISSDDTQINSDNINENLRDNPRKSEIVYKYGEFFPPELSPFAYNETIAQEYFPLTKEQAIEQGYSWKDPEERNIPITIKSEDLPDNIKEVDDFLLSQIIECDHKGICNEQCTKAFRVISSELEFYRDLGIPIPRLCPNCRHYQRLKWHNPIKFYKRKCQCAGTKSENGVYQNTTTHQHGEGHCPNQFETTYSPDRPEIVYCEQCYNNEVA